MARPTRWIRDRPVAWSASRSREINRPRGPNHRTSITIGTRLSSFSFPPLILSRLIRAAFFRKFTPIPDESSRISGSDLTPIGSARNIEIHVFFPIFPTTERSCECVGTSWEAISWFRFDLLSRFSSSPTWSLVEFGNLFYFEVELYKKYFELND